jgi:hypothetical protein
MLRSARTRFPHSNLRRPRSHVARTFEFSLIGIAVCPNAPPSVPSLLSFQWAGQRGEAIAARRSSAGDSIQFCRLCATLPEELGRHRKIRTQLLRRRFKLLRIPQHDFQRRPTVRLTRQRGFTVERNLADWSPKKIHERWSWVFTIQLREFPRQYLPRGGLESISSVV